MNEREKYLLSQEIGHKQPDLLIRTDARIDTGLWFRRTPMWLCVVDSELVMLSVARRRYVARVPISEISSSYYNHSTGEFVIEPRNTLMFSQFPMSPRDALKLLSFFKNKNQLTETI